MTEEKKRDVEFADSKKDVPNKDSVEDKI